MIPIIFDGKALAGEKEKVLAKRVEGFKTRTGITPKLVSFLVGDNPASKLYLRLKAEVAERVGIEFEKREFTPEAGLETILASVRQVNDDKSVHGIMIQLPLPKDLEIVPPLAGSRHGGRNWKLEILGAIAPRKDVDCLTPENLGLLLMGEPRFLPATVRAILTIAQGSRLKAQGSNAIIVGASNIVGKPLAIMLSTMGATVTVCRSTTGNLSDFTKGADILVSATGVPGLIKKEMIKRGAVVIDVGAPKPDVDPAVGEVASFLTPVPGGVGPLTVISLLENTLDAAERQTP